MRVFQQRMSFNHQITERIKVLFTELVEAVLQVRGLPKCLSAVLTLFIYGQRLGDTRLYGLCPLYRICPSGCPFALAW